MIFGQMYCISLVKVWHYKLLSWVKKMTWSGLKYNGCHISKGLILLVSMVMLYLDKICSSDTKYASYSNNFFLQISVTDVTISVHGHK